jgi:hypothetical protein
MQPLTPTASPGTAASYRNLLRQVNQYVGQMTAHIHGIAVASHASDDDDDERDTRAMEDGTGQWGE